MTIRSANQQLLMCLFEYYDNNEASVIANMIMEKITGLSRVDRLLHHDAPIGQSNEQQLKHILLQLENRRPVQYILEEAYFYGLRFYVNESVLIPRPETEELVDWIVSDNNPKSQLQIVDIGTGSGCIPISIKSKLKDATVTGIDISLPAIEIAKSNAVNNQIDVAFLKLDFLNKSERDTLGKFDIIVSNPPYVKQSESASMKPHVLDFEPYLALFVPDENALIFYEHIAAFAQQHLSEHGSIYVEINEALGDAVQQLFLSYGFSKVVLKNDLQGKARMVKAAR